MALDFNALKKSSKKDLNSLVEEAKKLQGNQAQDDKRFWNPTVGKDGNGYAVIRFLPAVKGEDVPWVRVYDHGFQGPGGLWYIENSLTTLGQADPVSEHNSTLWATGLDSNKKIVRERKRRIKYYSNILVVKDEGNKENEGKVFLYRFGPKIFDKIKEAMCPEFEDEKPINPFDLWEGADFKLKIRNVENYRNYDKSEFAEPQPISDDDKVLKEIWEKEYPLKEFIDPANFKSYDELKTRFYRVIAESSGSDMTEKVRAKSAPTADPDEDETAPWEAASADDDKTESKISFFQKMAED
jgi:hypothetical protein